MDERCVLYISSCDKYADLWEPFFILFKKYWPDCPYPIVLASETKTFSFPGLNIQCPRFFKPGQRVPWGMLNIKTVQSTRSPFVFFMLEDFLLEAPVDQGEIGVTLDWIEKDPKVGRFGFFPLRGKVEPSNKYPPYNLLTKKTLYRVTAQPGLWRKSVLLKSMLPNENPWLWERNGSRRSLRWTNVQLYCHPEVFVKIPPGGSLIRGKWHKPGVKVLADNGIPFDFSLRGFHN
ncbi:MAG: hypothetical protein LBS11_05525 [Oscillospiraceae bacterium]|nr:hypothetical protein [Oscillospiraceae bacterium]